MVGVCTRRSPNSIPPSSYIKVHIYELAEQMEGETYTHFAGGLPFPPREKCRDDYSLHTFNQAPKLLVRFQQLHSLHVHLTNEYNENIKLGFGPPTIVWLELTNMQPSDEFTTTCLSHQPLIFPSNTPAAFETPLPSEMVLDNYEVALLQVVYPAEMQEKVMASLKIRPYTWSYNLSELETSDEFIAAVQRDIANSSYAGHLTFKKLEHGEYRGRLMMAMRWTYDWRTHGPIIVEPSSNFTKACGQRDTPRAKTTLRPNNVFIFDSYPNISLGRENPIAMLHCDIIKPNVMCGEHGQVLQCVPVLANREYHQGDRMHEPPQMAFHPVANLPITRIGFKFTNPDGRIREFKARNASDAVIITLLFRKRFQ